ncbi:hypothetical protein BDV38DRAFT_276919 [Aspergillus pseudotamarii]|uniref:Starter acyltransferase (SAT) domain-containing protein n=1 Tax=Aspergillus pseudotamarii TaxID=132259 RepID=A0A5N6TC48_ASPPS|nr:uncharacterized protein BDV38DRAFT_276919 [Aspergillus pseudotamarii]KAE8143850.1 hypothetical protein BDV38DRAFT_276919 [Aspergillus pseudotamarii]
MVQNVFLFGPQVLSLDVDDIKTLRDTLHSTPSNRWALDCLSELPDLWDVVTKNVSQLKTFDGKPLLKRFVDEFNAGSTSPSTFLLPANFMQESVAAGLCTGLLGAMTASHSGTLQSLATNSAKTVRQAMAIGGMVDAEMASNGTGGRATSFSVSWDSFLKGKSYMSMSIVAGDTLKLNEMMGHLTERRAQIAQEQNGAK